MPGGPRGSTTVVYCPGRAEPGYSKLTLVIPKEQINTAAATIVPPRTLYPNTNPEMHSHRSHRRSSDPVQSRINASSGLTNNRKNHYR